MCRRKRKMTGLLFKLKNGQTGIKKLRKTLFQNCNWMLTLFERRLFDVQTVFWSVAIKTVDHLPLLKNVCPFTLHKWPKIKINKTELTIFKTVRTFQVIINFFFISVIHCLNKTMMIYRKICVLVCCKLNKIVYQSCFWI